MNLKEKKLIMLNDLYSEFDNLLNISNKIELNYIYYNISEYNLNLEYIKPYLENTFNYKFEYLLSEINKQYSFNKSFNKNFNKDFSYCYKFLNNVISELKEIIFIYGKYIKNDISLKSEIEQLNLNYSENIKSEYFNNYNFYKLFKTTLKNY